MYYEEAIIDDRLMYRIKPNGNWYEVSSLQGTVVKVLLSMTEEERLNVLQYFCLSCGGLTPCNCRRDD